MNSNDTNASTCPVCGGKNITSDKYTDHFDYIVGGNTISLIAEYPVESCKDCHFVSSGEVAEIARDISVRKHLGLLIPQQIKAIREKYSLTRQAFAELTGIGITSLARWENGELIQNKSSDTLLRFLEEPNNYKALTLRFRKDEKTEHLERFQPKMRVLKGSALDHALKQSELFHLTIKTNKEALCI